jgi:hypothetical protein
MTQVEQIDAKIAKIVGTLADELIAPFEVTLGIFEVAMPGITERLKGTIDPETIKRAFTEEVGKSIQALKEEGNKEILTAAIAQVAELRGLLEGQVSAHEDIKTLITQAGGIFVGKDELLGLGKLSADFELPPIPEKFSTTFFNATHPTRGGTIASRIILGFDVETNQWYCIEKMIVPESRNLSGSKQDKLLQNQDGSQIEVEGVKTSSPKDSKPIERVLDNVIALHLKVHLNDEKAIDWAPFSHEYARTADTVRADHGCRVLLGCSHESGSRIAPHSDAAEAEYDIGLLAGWN